MGSYNMRFRGKITEIPDSAFYYKTNLTGIEIPETVTTIGASAFRGSTLTAITIPDTVTMLKERAFQDCNSLTSATVGNSIENLYQYTFLACRYLQNITLGNSLKSINNQCFSNCNNLKSVVIPDSVETIENEAFNNCNSLTSATIGNSVKTIGTKAFNQCNALKELTIGNSVETISDNSFNNCRSLTSVTIPDSVITLGADSFYNDYNIQNLTIGNSVKTIGDYCFYNNYNLSAVTIPDSVTTLGNNNFQSYTGLTSINIGSGLTSVGNYFLANCYNLSAVTIPDSVTTIGDLCFYNDYNLKTIEFGSGVTTFNSANAVYYCTGLEYIEFKSPVPPTITGQTTPISASTIFPNTNLCPIFVPDDSVEAYKEAWVYDAWRIVATSNREIGATIESNEELIKASRTSGYIGSNATNFYKGVMANITPVSFYHSKVLTSFNEYEYFTSETRVNPSAFESCEYLTTIKIPEGVTSIGGYAFYNHRRLKFMDVPKTLTAFEAYALRCDPSGAWVYLTMILQCTQIPTVGDLAFRNMSFDKIYVIYNLYDDYLVDSAWKGYASVIEQFVYTVDDLSKIVDPQEGELCYIYNDKDEYAYRSGTWVKQVNITVQSEDTTMGSVSGSGLYDINSSVNISASANTGYEFVQWQDGNTDNPRTITATVDTTYIAEFETITQAS